MTDAHDTPEAVLAAALDKAGVAMPDVRSLHDPGGTPNRLRQAREVLAAMPDWTLALGGGDVIERGIELARQQAAEIARLRAALAMAGWVAWGTYGGFVEPTLLLTAREARAALAPSEP